MPALTGKKVRCWSRKVIEYFKKTGTLIPMSFDGSSMKAGNKEKSGIRIIRFL